MSSAEQIRTDITALRGWLAGLRTQIKNVAKAAKDPAHETLLGPLVAFIGDQEQALEAAGKAAEVGLAERDRLQLEISAVDAERRTIATARAALPHHATFDAARVLELRDAADVNYAREKWLRACFDVASSRAEQAASKTIGDVRRWTLGLTEHDRRASSCFYSVIDPVGSSPVNVRQWASSASPVDRASFVFALLKVDPARIISNGGGAARIEWETALKDTLLPMLSEQKEAA
jgi:hypothetical protein